MLLKFTTSDMLNTSLIDIATGETVYAVVTSMMDTLKNPPSLPDVPPPFGIISPSLVASHHSSSTISANSSNSKIQPELPEPPSTETRKTEIRTHNGDLLAEIKWNGRRPDISLLGQHVGPLTALFDLTSVKLLPDTLAIPSRFDTEYVWNATASSLTLIDLDSEKTKGVFHQNSIRVLPSSSSSHKFINTRIPGFGHSYLEFDSHPLVEDVEIIVSFFMMEILRRGRFSLTPYMFERPKLWQIIEAKDLIMRRLRRNTV